MAGLVHNLNSFVYIYVEFISHVRAKGLVLCLQSTDWDGTSPGVGCVRVGRTGTDMIHAVTDPRNPRIPTLNDMGFLIVVRRDNETKECVRMI